MSSIASVEPEVGEIVSELRHLPRHQRAIELLHDVGEAISPVLQRHGLSIDTLEEIYPMHSAMLCHSHRTDRRSLDVQIRIRDPRDVQTFGPLGFLVDLIFYEFALMTHSESGLGTQSVWDQMRADYTGSDRYRGFPRPTDLQISRSAQSRSSRSSRGRSTARASSTHTRPSLAGLSEALPAPSLHHAPFPSVSRRSASISRPPSHSHPFLPEAAGAHTGSKTSTVRAPSQGPRSSRPSSVSTTSRYPPSSSRAAPTSTRYPPSSYRYVAPGGSTHHRDHHSRSASSGRHRSTSAHGSSRYLPSGPGPASTTSTHRSYRGDEHALVRMGSGQYRPSQSGRSIHGPAPGQHYFSSNSPPPPYDAAATGLEHPARSDRGRDRWTVYAPSRGRSSSSSRSSSIRGSDGFPEPSREIAPAYIPNRPPSTIRGPYSGPASRSHAATRSLAHRPASSRPSDVSGAVAQPVYIVQSPPPSVIMVQERSVSQGPRGSTNVTTRQSIVATGGGSASMWLGRGGPSSHYDDHDQYHRRRSHH